MAFTVGEQVVALAKIKGSGGNKVKPGWQGHCIALGPKDVSFSFEIKEDSLFGNIQGFTKVKLSHEDAATKVSRVVKNSSQTYEQPASQVSFTQSATVSPLERNLSTSEIIDKLTQLKNLRDSGVLTDEEFNNFKAELTSKNVNKSLNNTENSVETNSDKQYDVSSGEVSDSNKANTTSNSADHLYDVWVMGIGNFKINRESLVEVGKLIDPAEQQLFFWHLKQLKKKSRSQVLVISKIPDAQAQKIRLRLDELGLVTKVDRNYSV